jgi:hypothetical protein
MRMLISATILAAAVSATAFASLATIQFDAPKGWTSRTPSSSMRLAEYTVPKVAGDSEDATVTVFFFGATQGGNVQANIDRWITQVAQPDGKSSKDVAKTTTMTSASGLKITIVDVSGTYVAEVAPGSAERFNKTGISSARGVHRDARWPALREAAPVRPPPWPRRQMRSRLS